MSQIQRDSDAVDHAVSQAQASGADVLTLDYEDLFGADVDLSLQVKILNDIFTFLRRPPVSMDSLPAVWRDQLSAAGNKWATVDLYRSIPGAVLLNEIAGSAETGYLFDA